MSGPQHSKKQLFGQLGGRVAVGRLTGQSSKTKTMHQAFQHPHQLHTFQPVFLFFPLMNMTSTNIYQMMTKTRMVTRVQILTQVPMMTPTFCLPGPVPMATPLPSLVNKLICQVQQDLSQLSNQCSKLSQLPCFQVVHQSQQLRHVPTAAGNLEALFLIGFTDWRLTMQLFSLRLPLWRLIVQW